MCGIVGICRRDGILNDDPAWLSRSLHELSRRGPDGQGIHKSEKVLFGHRRLAIQDVLNGQQPLKDPHSGVVLNYNGEIFNFLDIREELESRGYRFDSHCDTEVLLKAYLEWGKQCLKKFKGMFAFAIYDPRENFLWLVRDRFGIKPLYYSQIGNSLLFASNLASLFQCSEIERKWDATALLHYFLTIRTRFGDRTVIKGVRTLLPGEFVTYSLETGSLEKRSYWRLPAIPSTEKQVLGDMRDLAAEAKHRLDESIAQHLISDVPVGTFLSGGIDSSILASGIRRAHSGRMKAYSIGYSKEGYNEWPFVRETASTNDIECEEIALDEPSYLADWKKLIAYNGLPLSTPNEVPIMRLAESFGSEFKVAMTGEGADELFGGYIGPTFSAYDLDRFYGRSGGMDASAWSRAYGALIASTRRTHFFAVNSWLQPSVIETLLPGLASGSRNGFKHIWNQYDSVFERYESCSTFDAYLHIHAEVNLEGLLNRLDSSTMAAGVEGRVPYTDHEMAEWIAALPDTLKMSLVGNTTWDKCRDLNVFDLQNQGLIESKVLLRAAFADRVPASILNRPKMSFPVPFLEWFNNSMAPEINEILNNSSVVSEMVSPNEKLSILSDNRFSGMSLWPLINVALMEDLWQIKF